MTEKRICFYHTDGDGYCSAALVAMHYNWELELYPINYDHDFPWDKIDSETDVIMVDFSLEPFPQMIRLLNACKGLLWIDHHKTAVKAYHQWAAETGLHIEGPKQIGEAACELTWCYYHDPAEHVPLAVHFLGRYDVWQHHDIVGALDFQWGVRAHPNVSPVEPEARVFWEVLLGENMVMRDYFTKKIIEDGQLILRHVRKQNKRAAKSGCFLTTFASHPDLCHHEFLACNVGGANSQFFEDVLEDYPTAEAALAFHYKNGCYKISMFSIKGREHPDLAAIAKEMGDTPEVGGGGGGHEGAAGFIWRSLDLPFSMPLKEKDDD